MSETIGVIGAGAFGTAMAQLLASDGSDVVLWAREAELVETINRDRRNPVFLPSAQLAPSIRATSDLAEAATPAVLVMVTPAQHLATIIAAMPPLDARDLVLCSKGIEAGTRRLMSDVAAEAAPGSEIAVFSGPTFAHEMAAGLPTAVTLACAGGDSQWQRLAASLARPSCRLYYSEDVVGAEIGGAVKNVLAIACGVVEGLALGQNARAALIARGYAEMRRFGLAMGAQPISLWGLAGLGDLVLTCSSTSSRNFSLGKALGEGASAAEVLAARNSVAEGAHTAPVLAALAREKGVEMPIVEAVTALLAGAAPAHEVVANLLARPLRAEQGD